ncbi:MAG TPA: hypothetical protein VM013_05080 [Dehalococcoidia bacterium]|nr:hypothetical protein [Dehalococcoidia bacterium]
MLAGEIVRLLAVAMGGGGTDSPQRTQRAQRDRRIGRGMGKGAKVAVEDVGQFERVSADSFMAMLGVSWN